MWRRGSEYSLRYAVYVITVKVCMCDTIWQRVSMCQHLPPLPHFCWACWCSTIKLGKLLAGLKNPHPPTVFCPWDNRYNLSDNYITEFINVVRDSIQFTMHNFTIQQLSQRWQLIEESSAISCNNRMLRLRLVVILSNIWQPVPTSIYYPVEYLVAGPNQFYPPYSDNNSTILHRRGAPFRNLKARKFACHSRVWTNKQI